MQFDVTDLFDDLFSVANTVYPDFGYEHDDESDLHDRWFDYCQDLSDALFVRRVAQRVYNLTHLKIPDESIKRRIIVRYRWGQDGVGLNTWYDRPRFFESTNNPSGFIVNLRLDDFETSLDFLSRPKHKLTFHLGPIPPFAFDSGKQRPEKPPPTTYYVEHDIKTLLGRTTIFYETRGDWVYRTVSIHGGIRHFEYRNGPRWMNTTDLQPIDPDLFHRLWAISLEKTER